MCRGRRYTDANIGRVLDELDDSPFAQNTVVALWGGARLPPPTSTPPAFGLSPSSCADHGYALGDNDEWAKQTNFEHATHIPFMISAPGIAPGRSDVLVEEVGELDTFSFCRLKSPESCSLCSSESICARSLPDSGRAVDDACRGRPDERPGVPWRHAGEPRNSAVHGRQQPRAADAIAEQPLGARGVVAVPTRSLVLRLPGCASRGLGRGVLQVRRADRAIRRQEPADHGL